MSCQATQLQFVCTVGSNRTDVRAVSPKSGSQSLVINSMEYSLAELPRIIDSKDLFAVEGTTHLVCPFQASMVNYIVSESESF